MMYFLGKDYYIPDDLDKYLKTLIFFEEMRIRLNSLIIEKLKSSETHLLDDEEILPIFRDEVKRIIQMLCDNGIYNKTIDEYINNNVGYEQLTITNKNACQEFCTYLQEHILSLGQIFEAENRAASSITGSPVTVYTSSSVMLAAAAAFDYSCAKQQFEKARQQYNKEVENIINSANSVQGNKEKNYLKSVYIPNIEQSITKFAFSAMEKYIEDLIDAGKFDKSTLDYVDSKRSNGILENLSLSIDKRAVLENAFLACPFNITVYEKAVEHKLLDTETIQTLIRYCPDNHVLENIIKECTINDYRCNYANEYERIKPYVPIVSQYSKQSNSDVLFLMYKGPYDYYKIAFRYLDSLLNLPNKRKTKEFVVEKITNDYSKLILITDDTLKDTISKIIDNDNLQFLIDIGFNFDSVLEKFNGDAVEYYTSKLSALVFEYISECKSCRKRLSVIEASYRKTIKEKQNVINALERSLSRAGILSFTKKRDLKDRISKAQNDLDTYKNNSKYNEEVALYDKYYI